MKTHQEQFVDPVSGMVWRVLTPAQAGQLGAARTHDVGLILTATSATSGQRVPGQDVRFTVADLDRLAEVVGIARNLGLIEDHLRAAREARPGA